MRADVFQAALFATARLSCSVALVSCQKSPNKPTELPPMMEHVDQVQEQLAAMKESVDSNSFSKEFAACSPKIDEFVLAQHKQETHIASEEVLACCELQGKEIDANMDGEWKYRNECCAVLEWQGPFACTPWGPPMPPHMVS